MLASTSQPVAETQDEGLRVVFIVNFLAPDLIAVCRRWSESVSHLKVLVSVPMEGNRQWDFEHDGIDVNVQRTWTITRTDRHPSGYQDVNYVHVPLDTYRQLRRLRPEVIVSAEMGARTFFASLYRHRHKSVQHVIAVSTSEHIEQSRNGRLRRKLRAWLLSRADAVTYHGESCRRYLIGLGVPSERLFPWYYAADRTKPYRGPLQTSVSDSHRITLLTVGQLIQRKGVTSACEHLKRWAVDNPDRKIVWTVGGSGPLEASLRAETLPANLSIEFLGNLSATQIHDLYSQHELMLFPTLGDEWGLVTDEAMHSGLAVIGSLKAQSCEVLLKFGINGFPYDPDDYASFRNSLDSWARMSPQARMAMRIEARNTVVDRTPETSAHQINSLCQQLAR
jgi:glycosyltransferase involved in cell wall biosynthesis